MSFKNFSFLIFCFFSFHSKGEEKRSASFDSAKTLLMKALGEDTFFFNFYLRGVYDFFKPFSLDFAHFHNWSREQQIEILQLWFVVCLRHPNVRLQMTFKNINEESWSHFRAFFAKWFQCSLFDCDLDPHIKLSLFEESVLIGNAAKRRQSEMKDTHFFEGEQLKIGGGRILKKTSFCRHSGATIFGPEVHLNMKQEDFFKLFFQALEDFDSKQYTSLFREMRGNNASLTELYFDRLITAHTSAGQKEVIQHCARIWRFVLDLCDVSALFKYLFEDGSKELTEHGLCPVE